MSVDDLPLWFANIREILETAYLAASEPWAKSGQSGPFERWQSLRKPVADCIDADGTFLDIGCANGYLLECCQAWTAERGIRIEPFGVDLSASLIELAQQRLPAYRDHFWADNAFTWRPPRRFTFVRTCLVYAPAEHERAYVLHLLAHYLEPGGRLLITNYGERNPHPEHGLLPGQQPTRFLLDRLQTLGIPVSHSTTGYDPIKDRHVRVAVITVPSEE